eukprot:TRINITY_DN105194_c0_g1_i1.p1 TRINITY_DN105194_c0_g1~~TRINITY_DN105194_c0_g1_i1.p1  ORF type:complete len:109 (+),score=0.51 TRINITY_DN105194_c0_g1_i1:53-379(+)
MTDVCLESKASNAGPSSRHFEATILYNPCESTVTRRITSLTPYHFKAVNRTDGTGDKTSDSPTCEPRRNCSADSTSMATASHRLLAVLLPLGSELWDDCFHDFSLLLD